MADHVYGTLELTGSSKEGLDQAVRAALARAQTMVKNVRWFEVTAMRGYVQDAQTVCWQVTLKVGHTLEG